MRKIEKNYNSVLIEMLGAKPIAFNPMLASVAKSALAGLFLSQLLYWDGKGRESDWVYKTVREVFLETHMNRSEQDRSIKIWKRLNVLEVELRGLPRKRHFKVNKGNLLQLLDCEPSKPLISHGTTYSDAESNQLDGLLQLINTESTEEITNKDTSCQSEDDIPFANTFTTDDG